MAGIGPGPGPGEGPAQPQLWVAHAVTREQKATSNNTCPTRSWEAWHARKTPAGALPFPPPPLMQSIQVLPLLSQELAQALPPPFSTQEQQSPEGPGGGGVGEGPDPL